jgi:hypothetical protein
VSSLAAGHQNPRLWPKICGEKPEVEAAVQYIFASPTKVVNQTGLATSSPTFCSKLFISSKQRVERNHYFSLPQKNAHHEAG